MILKFCEHKYKKPKNRIFNVKLGDEYIVKELDIMEKTEGRRFIAYDEYIELEFKDG